MFWCHQEQVQVVKATGHENHCATGQGHVAVLPKDKTPELHLAVCTPTISPCVKPGTNAATVACYGLDLSVRQGQINWHPSQCRGLQSLLEL